MERIILHIDMDYFFAQIEERENPRFKGKPVVVGSDPKGGKGRGVVSTANYIARKYGIHSALPISKAYQLCPDAIFLPVNMEFYEKVSESIMEIIKKYSTKQEITSLDEAYLDLSFLKNYQEAENLAKKLKEKILEKEKLTSTIGIGPNKIIAKMATNKGKPNGLFVVKLNEVDKFLEPLDIEDLPGIGPKTAEKLRIIGVDNIKKLKELPKTELIEMFGKVGETIYQRTRGFDESPVISEETIKSIGKEHTFEKDTRDSKVIFGILENLIEGVHKEIIENDFSFKTITVVCRFQGFETHTKSKTLEGRTKNFNILKKEGKKLLLRFVLENPKLIRLVGLRVSSLK